MGRRPKHEAHDPTRTRILAAAIDVFAEAGYAGASVRDIGARAKLNPAGVTYYFATKQKLWLAAAEELSRPLLAIAMSTVAQRRPARDTLRALLGALFDAFAADPRPARLMMWNALQAGQLDFDRTLAIFQPLISFGVSYVETAQRAGEVPHHVDVPVVLPLVFGMFIYTFIAQPGQRRHFGADVSDPRFGARARTALLDSVDRMLGFTARTPRTEKRRPRDRRYSGRPRPRARGRRHPAS